ncbi:MAG TPA: adenine deaminase [Phycisphaerales bacterium]|nr:adenine deaminase [Phycisphaerales bacterium]
MPPYVVTPELLAVARGDAPADVLLVNARIVNVFTCEVEEGCIAVHGDRIAGVGPGGMYERGREVVDVKGAFVAPGLIDAHMHVESTMLPPSEFVRLAVSHGTTGAVLDPHEIANVLGVAGIKYIVTDAAGLPFEAMFAVSSCVPSSPLETSGARLEAYDLEPLFEISRVVALAEMMNFPGVINGDERVLAKVNLGLSRRIVDGHAPGLRGRGLRAYVGAGISSDHECTTAEEALEKARLGMRIFIREGSAARNLEAILPAVTAANAHLFCFCTDDRHPADLHREGHIDHVVRKAIGLGLDPCRAIAMGSLHAARHYRRTDLGAIAPGHLADFFVFDDLREPRARVVYKSGEIVARDGEFLGAARTGEAPPRSVVRLPKYLTEGSFRVVQSWEGSKIRVVEMRPGQIVTGGSVMEPLVRDGNIVADPSRDLVKLAVIERHVGSGNIGIGFVRGFGLREGAIASTVGHDSHNLAVLGVDDADMLLAARTLSACGGGQCAVRGGKLVALLPLPIAGLMSDQPAAQVIEDQAALLRATKELGCGVEDPFMPLSFMCLPVIPKLKVTDLGLVDVEKFEVVPLEM